MKIIDFTKVENIFIVCGKTDMRRQIDGLAATVIQEYDMNVYDDAYFYFVVARRIVSKLCIRKVMGLFFSINA